jgi:hypothetical protein
VDGKKGMNEDDIYVKVWLIYGDDKYNLSNIIIIQE